MVAVNRMTTPTTALVLRVRSKPRVEPAEASFEFLRDIGM
jgi:hypothetical protein